MAKYNPNKIASMHAPTFFISATSLHTGELQTHIHQALNNGLTGLIRVHFQMGKSLTLVVQYGHIRQIYICNHRVPDLNWELPLRMYGEATLAIQPAPARA